MKRKMLLVALALVCALTCVFGLVACDSGNSGNDGNGNGGTDNYPPPQHTHTYSEEWSYDETYHWHSATCEHKNEVSDKAEHTFLNGICSVCKYEKIVTPSKGLEYSLNKEGTAYTVAGIGTCTDPNIIIPSEYEGLPVTQIGNYAFEGNNSIISVSIPNGITNIGTGAFYSCYSLISIVIGNDVQSIGTGAFNGCFKLIEVCNYSALELIAGSTDNGNIAYYALNVYIPTSGESRLTETDEGYVFYENSETVYLVDYSGTETSLILPELFNNKNYGIYKYAFYACNTLTSVKIPDSVTSVGNSAFENCAALISVVIGNSVTNIERATFRECTSLTNITFGNNITHIESYAFQNCSSLQNITLPDGLTNIDMYAFQNCSSLRNITLPDTITTINSGVFENCSSLTSIKIPNGVTSISYKLFSGCSSLSNIVIPDNVENIQNFAFENCISLIKVTIGKNIRFIVDDAFHGCVRLIEVCNYSALELIAGSTDNGYIAYYALNVYTPTSGESKLTETDEGYIFYENGETVYLVGYSGTETSLILPELFNNRNYGIYKYAFYACNTLTSVKIPYGVTSIEDATFAGCTSLNAITIPSSVTSIGEVAFAYCNSLSSITYSGTNTEWIAIEKNKDWDSNTGNYTVYCTDGEITKD